METPLIGNHPTIEKIRELISMVSDTAFNVLLLGETGTGKEVVARLLHQASNRRNQRFIKVNCAALPQTLLESELFGYEKGAFTGAIKSKPGKFELASEGVLFLDEIGDMPAILQGKLLHILQSGEFSRLGGTEDVKINTWVIAATNHDLQKDMKQGLFREDLYYRINIIKIEIPPLNERREDLPLLTEHCIQKYHHQFHLDNHFRLNPDMAEMFRVYHWPGNVRELSSVILRLMLGDDPGKMKEEMINNMQADGLTLPQGMIQQYYLQSGDGAAEKSETLNSHRPLKEVKAMAINYIERKAIVYALNMTGWNKREAAKMLKISYKALFYKMDNLGILKGKP